MAVPILTENPILVYDFVHSRSKTPFEKTIRAHIYTCARSLLAYSGETLQKDELKTWNRIVNKNQLMRQCRIGLEFFQIFLWALVFGHYFNIYQPIEQKKNPSHRRKHAKAFIC
jgi:hypothetical protein